MMIVTHPELGRIVNGALSTTPGTVITVLADRAQEYTTWRRSQ
jgi:hypothetical protein